MSQQLLNIKHNVFLRLRLQRQRDWVRVFLSLFLSMESTKLLDGSRYSKHSAFSYNNVLLYTYNSSYMEQKLVSVYSLNTACQGASLCVRANSLFDSRGVSMLSIFSCQSVPSAAITACCSVLGIAVGVVDCWSHHGDLDSGWIRQRLKQSLHICTNCHV